MIVGNIENFKGKGLVAFLDILGFRQEMMDNWNNEEANPLAKILDLKQKLPVLDKYHEFVNNPKQTGKVYACRVQTISDSIIVSFGFEENMQYGDFILGVLSFLDMIAGIWRNALESGFTIRGAMDYGSIFWNPSEIIGPSFIRAYEAEAKYAKTSRVIVTSNFNKQLKEMLTKPVKTFYDNYIYEMLRKDIDGYLIFNPHALYAMNENEKEEKKYLVELILRLKRYTTGLISEKYVPLLATLQAEKYNLREIELGHY